MSGIRTADASLSHEMDHISNLREADEQEEHRSHGTECINSIQNTVNDRASAKGLKRELAKKTIEKELQPFQLSQLRRNYCLEGDAASDHGLPHRGRCRDQFLSHSQAPFAARARVFGVLLRFLPSLTGIPDSGDSGS